MLPFNTSGFQCIHLQIGPVYYSADLTSESIKSGSLGMSQSITAIWGIVRHLVPQNCVVGRMAFQRCPPPYDTQRGGIKVARRIKVAKAVLKIRRSIYSPGKMTLPESYISCGKDVPPIPAPSILPVSSKGKQKKNIVNREKGFKEIDWKNWSQRREERMGIFLLRYWRNTCEDDSPKTEAH